MNKLLTLLALSTMMVVPVFAQGEEGSQRDGTSTEVTQGALKDGDRVIVAALVKAAPASGRSPGSPGGRGPGF